MSLISLEELSHKINEHFGNRLIAAIKLKFNIKVETQYDIFDKKVYTFRKDSAELTFEQRTFIKAYSKGFADALDILKNGTVEYVWRVGNNK